MPVIDYTDPLQVLTAMREAYDRAMVEGRAQEVEYSAGNGSSRRVRREFFSAAELRQRIAELEKQCAGASRPSTILIHSSKGL